MSARTITNVRIMDPESGYDGHGAIHMEEGYICAFGDDVSVKGDIIDGGGLLAVPGLIDMRVITGEPGRESKETLASAGQAAVAGGVTTMVVFPQTKPVIDDAALVDYILKQGVQTSPVNVLVAAAMTKQLAGQEMAEIGLMQQAGATFFCNGEHPVANSGVMRQILAYSSAFGALIAHRPVDAALRAHGCAHESYQSARMGLAGDPAIGEQIMIERDAALLGLTGGRLLVDMISSAGALESIRRAKGNQLDICVSVSIHHLCLNETDIGAYRSFAKLDPPLRAETDRRALLDAVNAGLIDVIVSAHAPHPSGEKRRPFAEAAAGAVGLETLLAAGLNLVASESLDLMAFLRATTFKPAQILGLNSGRIACDAPADIVLCDPAFPWKCKSGDLHSASKNTPFDGMTLTGRVMKTFIGGECVYEALCQTS